MDNRKQELTDLMAKVEAGKHPTGSFLLHMRSAFPHHDKLAHAAYNGSLDAAMALHEAVLPNYNIGLMNKVNTGKWSALVYPKGPKIAEWVDNETPARAWLIAIIEALIAQETE